MKERLVEVQRLLEEARKLAGSQLAKAIEVAERAVAVTESLDGDEPVLFEARGAALSELAMLLQRRGDLSRAHDAYARAEQQIRSLPLDQGNPRHRLLLATTLINTCTLAMRRRELDDAAARIDEALSVLDDIPGAGAVLDVLRVGALQNRAAVEVELQRTEDAERTLTQALEIGARVVTTAPQLLPQLVEVSGRLAAVLRSLGRAGEAVGVAERAARWAEAAYEAGSPMGLGLYVSTQLLLVDTNFGAGRFAQAEDHLWKAVEVAPGPQTVLVGTGFYCSCLRQSDAALSAGDLPRDEVVDAFDELVDRLRGTSPPAGVVELVGARRAVLVDGDAEAGEAVLAAWSGVAQGVVGELSKALRSDVAWCRSRVSASG